MRDNSLSAGACREISHFVNRGTKMCHVAHFMFQRGNRTGWVLAGGGLKCAARHIDYPRECPRPAGRVDRRGG